jgi:fibronectin type III domain protein
MTHLRTLLALAGLAGIMALGAGCEGGDSTSAAVNKKSDETAPTAPTSLSVTGLGARRLTLNWNRSEDDVGVARYVIRRNGIDLHEVSAGTVTYTVKSLAPVTEYRFTVAAVDEAGNRSRESAPVAVTTRILVARQRLVFRPVADAYVTQVRPFSAYGVISRKLRMDGKPIRRSYLRFEVAGLKGRVTHATLKLWANKGSSRGYFVHRVDPVLWYEGSITYAAAPGFEDGVITSSGPFPPEIWTEAEIRRLVQEDSVVTIALTTDDVTLISLASREAGAHAPRLVVKTVRPLRR